MDYISKQKILTECTRLVNYLIVKNKSFLPGEYFNTSTEEFFGNAMIDDFGDYIPFVYWLGEVNNSDELEFKKWSENKASYIIDNFQSSNGLFVTNVDFKNKKYKKNSLWNIYDTDSMSDLSLGLNLMYQLTSNEYYLDSSKSFFGGLVKNCLSRNGYVNYKVAPKLKLHFPFSSGKFSGLYIEELVRLFKFTQDEKYLEWANKLTKPYLQSKVFQKVGLFDFGFSNKYLKPLINCGLFLTEGLSVNFIMTSKSNTNFIYGLTEL